ncbi:hypothetical protein ACHAW5_002008 [Stephanodiscus triporus]|uniref:AB hydrolase-1 domain-containing protein n=1 Tax=Stephanodiscus triporus TaxID=2934178 RepID=A0ABD3NWV7_9STRA
MTSWAIDDGRDGGGTVVDRLLRLRVAADLPFLHVHHPASSLLLRNPKMTAPAFLLLYVVLIVIWVPLNLLSRMMTEMGVCLVIFAMIVHAGRCLLRLLAFPGSNVRVYGEVEREFSRYSCEVIENAAAAIEELAMAATSTSTEDDDGEDEGGGRRTTLLLRDARSRANAYGDRILGTGMATSAFRAFIGMIDPPPHDSIFGLDVIRGCLLARYVGARQFWVDRGGCVARWWWWCGGGGGKLDVIAIPSSVSDDGGRRDDSVESFLPLSPRKGRGEEVGGGGNVNKKKRKAVLYCNPNAGLVEVATGMGLTGGNVDDSTSDDDEKEPTCWTEFYIDHGYDVYLFNYAGYGRSFGGSSWNQTTAEFSHGFLGALKRVLFSTFLAFKPSSESLKFDAAVVARHIVDVVGVDELVIHGESIGGMAAAGAAKALTATLSLSNVSTVLVCDRTFCNLEAVAQRLVGRWTGNAIRLLTPTWSNDVTRDFLAARCPKIVAQDSADEIIHDYSSLKSGLALAGELTKGQTSKVGWMMSPLIEYQIANLDNVSVTDSRLLSTSHQIKKSPPFWPADKHVLLSEAHHFAACVTRIGKLATAAKKQMQAGADTRHPSGDDEGIEVSLSSDKSPKLMPAIPAKKKNAEAETLIKLWKSLACCDGLCGHPLGHTVKEGFDCTISWLCCTVVFGPQVLAEQAEKRWDKQSQDASISLEDGRVILPEDFDLRPLGYQLDEDSAANYPLPIPEVLSSLKVLATQMKAAKVEAELIYIIGMLEYIVARTSSKEVMSLSVRRRNGFLDEQGVISTGCFLNLHCGHNNQYSLEERRQLIALIRRSCGDSVL